MAALMGAAVFTGQTTAHSDVRPPGDATQRGQPRLSAPLLPRGPRGEIRRLADAQLTEACELLDGTGDARMRAWSAFLRGAAALLSGDAEAAVRFHLRSIELVQQVPEAWGDGMLYSLMIKAFRDAGSFAAGTAIAERALAAARRGANRATEAFTLHELGLLTMLAGEPARAVEQCRDALQLARSTGRRTREGYALLRLAQTLLGAGHTEEAVRTAADAVRALTEASDPSQRGVALAVLAEALEAQGEIDRARASYRDAADVFAKLGLPAATGLYALAGM
jgi:tetratricopeptide (TPR) repeat protein